MASQRTTQRRINSSPEYGLRDASDRLDAHTYNCMPCLRRKAGLNDKARCATREAILRQAEVFRNAIANQETP